MLSDYFFRKQLTTPHIHWAASSKIVDLALDQSMALLFPAVSSAANVSEPMFLGETNGKTGGSAQN